MAHLIAKGTSREAQTTCDELQRLPYSRPSFERIGHAVGKLYCDAAPRIEEALIQAYDVPPEAKSISISIDRVSLAMEESAAKPPVKRDKKRVKMLDDFLKNAKPRHAIDPHLQASLDHIKKEAKRHKPKERRKRRSVPRNGPHKCL